MYLLKNEPHFQENAVPSLPRKLQARTDRGKTAKYSFASYLSLKSRCASQKLQSDVIGLAHECHLGMDKTVALIRETCLFPENVQKGTGLCQILQRLCRSIK